MTTTFAGDFHAKAPDERHDLERLAKGPNAYRTISEVADELHVPQHVLRFWETRFPEVKPLKRGGGRRYYSPEDIDVLRQITDLLYVQGYTIKGVQRVLKDRVRPDGHLAGDLATSSPQVPAPATAGEAARTPFDIPDFPMPDAGIADTGMADTGTACVDNVEASDRTHSAHEVGLSETHIETSQGDHAGLPAENSDNHAAEEAVPVPVADPGEETSAAALPGLDDAQETDDAGGAVISPDLGVEAILREELADLKAKHDRWKQERRALRLALEDVLKELDSLRQMVPSR